MSAKRDLLRGKRLSYWSHCRKLRDLPGGEEVWREIMRNAVRISRDVFIRACDFTTLSKDEQLDDFIADDSGSYFARSALKGNTVYFICTKGFEFIWEMVGVFPNLKERRFI